MYMVKYKWKELGDIDRVYTTVNSKLYSTITIGFAADVIFGDLVLLKYLVVCTVTVI